MFTDSFIFYLPAGAIAIVLFISILLVFRLGVFLRQRILLKNKDKEFGDFGAFNGAIMGLLALLMAFTFGMSNSRYDARREAVVKEANAISTAILRTDIYPDSMRMVLRGLFRQYLEARIGYFQAGVDTQKTKEEYMLANKISSQIWSITANYAKVNDVTTRTSQLIPALNDMIDIVTTRQAAGEAHLPPSIIYFLLGLCLCVAFIMGYDKNQKIDWIVPIGFAFVLSFTILIIFDLDRPRRGFITLDKPNQKIVELREMLVEP
jgi:hypothetical protein